MIWLILIIGFFWLMNKKTIVDIIKDESRRQSVDWRLAFAIAWVESKLNPTAISQEDPADPDRSLGLFQIYHTTDEFIGGRSYSDEELLNPEINTYLGVKYIAYQLERYNQDTRRAVGAYNAGSYSEKAPGLAINEGYIRKVMALYEAVASFA